VLGARQGRVRHFLLLCSVPFFGGGSTQMPHELRLIMPGNGEVAYCRIDD